MGWQLNAHRVARTRISVGRLRDRLLRRQNNANSLFFWFVWIGHQTERINRIASLKMSNLSLVKFIRIPNVRGRQRISRRNLGQQIVSAASRDFAPSEFAHCCRLGQNDSRVDIRRIGFAASDMRLINQ